MATQTTLTAEQFDQMPLDEEHRWELIDGELIEMPSATLLHNRVLMLLMLSAGGFAHFRKLGSLYSDTEFAFGDQRLRPDLFLLSNATEAKADFQKLPLRVIPELAVEIVSPSESAVQLQRKVDAYLKAGIREVWTVYTSGQQIFQFRDGGIVLRGPGDTLDCLSLPGWALAVDDLFALP